MNIVEQERKLARLALEVAERELVRANEANIQAIEIFNSINFEYKKAKEKYENAANRFPNGINWGTALISEFTPHELEALGTIKRWNAV